MGNNRELIGKILEASESISKKGKNSMEAGYIWATYVPINEIEIIQNHHIMKVKEWLKNKKNMFIIEDGEFTPREIIASRYASKMINNKFYSVVNIESLNK